VQHTYLYQMTYTTSMIRSDRFNYPLELLGLGIGLTYSRATSVSSEDFVDGS
jgi:hypothetical protein